ncbi:hypothetical protein EVG20_g8603 [Dentipellis fragilis]|uniref:UBC core domain-containing protein n=1 Tax=Dentipellis fragilis TaxID=205917 RepID=A0A4Y9Y781_9AGAM|nr:hypothetical protein EVG20_g8603 [Dentipellis fragilis]
MHSNSFSACAAHAAVLATSFVAAQQPSISASSGAHIPGARSAGARREDSRRQGRSEVRSAADSEESRKVVGAGARECGGPRGPAQHPRAPSHHRPLSLYLTMAVPRTLNKNNSAVKRIMQEARELANDPCTDYHAAPLEVRSALSFPVFPSTCLPFTYLLQDDIFVRAAHLLACLVWQNADVNARMPVQEWHCTLRGPQGTDFEGGLYHFRILLPAEYPFRPPSILLLTPNGRFELNTKPAWGVRTAAPLCPASPHVYSMPMPMPAIIGLQGFFPLTGQAALGVGSLETSASERRRLAALYVSAIISSRDWECPHCKQKMVEMLPDPPAPAPAPAPVPAPRRWQPTVGTPAPAPAPSPPAAPSTAAARLTVTSDRASSTPIEPATERRLAEADSDSTRAARGSATPSPALTPSSADAARASGSGGGQESRTPRRPPLLLDGMICVLLVLVCALVAKRIV